jgi:sugar lactone lactonase YvrE
MGQQPLSPSSVLGENSIARECLAEGVVCLEKGGARLPSPFYREPANGSFFNNYGDVSIDSDVSWSSVSKADFVVFNEELAKGILGKKPKVDFMFAVSPYLHESPVYVPGLNRLFFSELSQNLPMYVVDLDEAQPTVEEYLADPPIYVPNGAFYSGGKIYYAVAGSNATVASAKLSTQQRPGIIALDPYTNTTEVLLNNYFGLALPGCDDIVVDPQTGFIWFTVPYYSWWLQIADLPPHTKSGTFRFDPKTGSVVIVDDDMRSPNGIAFSPNSAHLYISDTAAAGASAPISMDVPSPGIPGILFNTTEKRTIYKYDVVDQGRAIVNKRPIHYDTIGTVPDGLKAARNGLVVTASGNGLTVLTEFGDVILRAQTNFTVNNFQWVEGADKSWTEVWMVGQGGVARVSWDLQGVQAR